MGRGKFYMKICRNSTLRGSSTGGGADNNWNSPIKMYIKTIQYTLSKIKL